MIYGLPTNKFNQYYIDCLYLKIIILYPYIFFGGVECHKTLHYKCIYLYIFTRYTN